MLTMYRLEINDVFSAAHAIIIAGQREPLHGHDWHVTVTVEGEHLDADGLLVDFHAVHAALRQIIAPFHNRSLNEVAPFDQSSPASKNPSAELVARHIADLLSAQAAHIGLDSARGVHIAAVRVTEAVGCAATYFIAD